MTHPAHGVSPLAAHLLEHLCRCPDPNAALDAMLPYLGQQLQCDRLFLYVRSPATAVGRVPFCWRRHDDVPQVYDSDWKSEPQGLADDDPMFRVALEAQPSLFINDVETASPDTLNREFEAENFGHRALVHAHLCRERQLYGVLQPCVFGQPRIWSESDRHLILQAVVWLTPLVVEYVMQHHPPTS